jgi:hypothetical protein
VMVGKMKFWMMDISRITEHFHMTLDEFSSSSTIPLRDSSKILTLPSFSGALPTLATVQQ